jgi:hypothetical protein
MTKYLKVFLVAALREGGYEEAARWLNDAPKQAVEKVAKIVMRALGFKGKVDEQAGKEIGAIIKSAPANQVGGPEKDTTDESNLAQYLVMLNSVIAAGSSGRYLLLDGFLHTDDCASLWKFDATEKTGELSIQTLLDEERYIDLRKTGVEIYILPKMALAELIALNKKLGENPDLYAKDLDAKEKPLVRLIYEYRIQTVTTGTKTVRKGKRGERQEPVEIPSEIEISGNQGVKAMLDSLRAALAARAQSVAELKELTKPKTS